VNRAIAKIAKNSKIAKIENLALEIVATGLAPIVLSRQMKSVS
jgi:hypothetical protein